MPIEHEDQQQLLAAHGYIELGMFEEANAGLEKINPFCRSAPEVLSARVAIYQGLEKWDLMAVAAGKLVEWNPSEPKYFIALAHALRLADSIQAAHKILTRAAESHPNEGTIQFNLACYEAQMGNLHRAKAHLTAATGNHVRFSFMALDDPDLEPLRASLARD